MHLVSLLTSHACLAAKEILNELEGLLGDVTNAIQTTDGNLLALSDLDFDVELNEQVAYNDLAILLIFLEEFLMQLLSFPYIYSFDWVSSPASPLPPRKRNPNHYHVIQKFN